MTLKYYSRLFKIYRNYQKKKIVLDHLPLRMWVELSSACNLNCVMCPNKELIKSDIGFMTWEVFKKIIDESKNFIYDMALHHRGESLLHPQAIKFIVYASQHIPMTKLHTNGTILNEKIIKGLIDSNLKRISFSFDGFEKTDYEKIRRGADFNTVVDNIKKLLLQKKQSGKKYPIIALELIELSDSQVATEKKDRFIKNFTRLGLNELIIKKPHNWAGYMKTNYKKKHYAPCTFLWNAMLIFWNGDVSPCAQDFFGKYIAGNVKEKSLKDIWNDLPMQKLRQGLIAKKYDQFPTCSQCDRLWRQTLFGVPKEYLKQILLKKMP